MLGDSGDLRPYDRLQRNPDGDMFGDRRGRYPAQVEDESCEEGRLEKKEVDVVPMVVGVLIGVMFVGLVSTSVYYCVRGRRHVVQETYISMESSVAPLQDQPGQSGAGAEQPLGRQDEGELE